MTYPWDFHSPQLSAQLAVHLQGDFADDAPQLIRPAECSGVDHLEGEHTPQIHHHFGFLLFQGNTIEFHSVASV